MNLDKAIKNINRSLIRKQPTSFNPLWIKRNLRTTYFYIIENIKTEFDQPDWDRIVSGLDHDWQRKWMKGVRMSRLPVRNYKNYFELERIIKKYEDKLYTFITQANKNDKQVCDWISIRLVRIAQKGNLLAKQKIITLISYLVDQWIEEAKLPRWKGYNDLIHMNIENCIRRFRYAGSFLGYLYRTLEYSGRGLKSLEAFSLDNYMSLTTKRHDNVVYNKDTGKAKIFKNVDIK